MSKEDAATAPDRFVLLDASRVAEDKLADVLDAGEGNVSVWLQMGEERDPVLDKAKMDALKAALDVGALSLEEHEAAVQRLVPDASDAEKAKVDLLQAAFDGGALTEYDFKNSIAKLHHALQLSVGDRVEFTDDPREWRNGTVTSIATESTRLCIYVRPDGFETSHVWSYLRQPTDPRNELELLQEELNRMTEERDGYKSRCERLLKEGSGGEGGKSLATLVQPAKGKYDMYGFCFQLRSTVLLKVTSVTVGCRSNVPVKMKVYMSEELGENLRSNPSRWHEVSEAVVFQQEGQSEPEPIELSVPIVLTPGVPVHVMVHSPDDMKAVIYHRAESPTTAEDGHLQILSGDAAQATKVVCNSYRGFAFCGTIGYSVLVWKNMSIFFFKKTQKNTV